MGRTLDAFATSERLEAKRQTELLQQLVTEQRRTIELLERVLASR